MSDSIQVNPSEIKIRMYRQGLGDCFLLRFPTSTDRPFFMLIDCGVIVGTEQAGIKMTRVAEDIRKETDNHINLLVVTHEHWDHLSGFKQAEPIFQEMQIDRIWFAWTEDPRDDLANRIRGERHAKLKALKMAADRYSRTNPLAADQIYHVLSFFGEALLATRSGPTTSDALASIQTGKGARKLEYHSPGEAPAGTAPLALEGVEGVQVYVLGPPRNEKLLKQSDPTKRGHEVYEPPLAISRTVAFYAAVQDDPARGGLENSTWATEDELDPEQRDLNMPFDPCYRIQLDATKPEPFFVANYGYSPPPTMATEAPDLLTGATTGDPVSGNLPSQPVIHSKLAGENGPAWRRIDDDWLQSAGELALQLDSDTNNTSLALAIQLRDGRVLLFPGDAQVGNWLSWHNYEWKHTAGEKAPPTTATNLLNSTVLYKVGHHASHNATLRDKGLQLMTHTDLVAMIPVNHAMATKKKWDMPFAPLRKALEEKARGRLLLIDEGVPLSNPATPTPHLTDEERADFLQHVRCKGDRIEDNEIKEIGYVEYTLRLD
jgi:hypothetical protein